MQVCSTDYVYHALLNTGDEIVTSILERGLRPLSDFPESDRWKEINTQLPGFFENLYEMVGRPVLQRPYLNSGVFVSPIDFRQLPDSLMYDKTRVKIPVSAIDPQYATLTYVWEDERVTLPFTPENREKVAELWTADPIKEWFARDNSKIFFYVPQVAVYQPDGIVVKPADIERFG